MKVSYAIVALLATTWLPEVIAQRFSLFPKAVTRRETGQTSADKMVQNILEWLHGDYLQNERKSRQGPSYLPPSNTHRPRPFEPAPTEENTIPGGSPEPLPPGIFPPPEQPTEEHISTEAAPPVESPTPHIEPEVPGPGEPEVPGPGEPEVPGPGEPEVPGPGEPETPGPSQPEEITPGTPEEQPGHPQEPGYPGPSEPGITSEKIPSEPEEPSRPTGYPPAGETPQPPFPTPPEAPHIPGEPEETGYPPAGQTPQPPFPVPDGTPSSPPSEEKDTPLPGVTPGPGEPTATPGIPEQPTSYPPSGETPQTPFVPSGPTEPEITSSSTFPPFVRPSSKRPEAESVPSVTETPSPNEPSSPTEQEPSRPTVTETDKPDEPAPEVTYVETPTTREPQEPKVGPEEKESSAPPTPSEEDLTHPPHIHAIDVECAKDMMTINIEFNREFNGIIYSKGYYNQPDCRYVNENSGQTKYSFTVKLDSCGTQFINAFDKENQSYLENVLVLQNEVGIQEIWDMVRSVRCLWEGNLNKSLTISLNIDMLGEEIITFSGDTAVARLDIQTGQGPFAPSATGLVPIGQNMTLVISVSGDPGFDIQVKECVAKDTTGNHAYPLTDSDGCVLRPKLFGSFQKTRNTENTGASIIAYAFFNAFKFPDLMELMIECSVELCKTDCAVCPDPVKINPGRRRRRDVHNETLGEPVKVGKLLKVLLPEDLSAGEAIVQIKQEDKMCMSVKGFVLATVLMISLLSCSSIFSAYMFLKNRRIYCKQQP